MVRGPLTPRQIRTICLWTMIDRTGPSESGLFNMLLHKVTAFIIMLGFMTFRVWHEQDSGKAGADKFCDFLNWESSKWVCHSDPTLCIKLQYPPKRDIFCNAIIIIACKVWLLAHPSAHQLRSFGTNTGTSITELKTCYCLVRTHTINNYSNGQITFVHNFGILPYWDYNNK